MEQISQLHFRQFYVHSSAVRRVRRRRRANVHKRRIFLYLLLKALNSFYKTRLFLLLQFSAWLISCFWPDLVSLIENPLYFIKTMKRKRLMSLPICLVPLHSEICESRYCSTLRGSRAHSTLTTCTNLCYAMSVNKNHSESLTCTLSSWRGAGQGERGSRHARHWWYVTPWWLVFLSHKTMQVQESLYFCLTTIFLFPGL